jgi:hypothetical protein
MSQYSFTVSSFSAGGGVIRWLGFNGDEPCWKLSAFKLNVSSGAALAMHLMLYCVCSAAGAEGSGGLLRLSACSPTAV